MFNPEEFTPEYTADVGIKKGEKVDYAILSDGKPVILIEAKWIGEPLQKHDSQLFRYFGTTAAKFAILTNGMTYMFYTDLEAPNKMDEKPFLEINLLDIKESQVAELKKFHKSNFNIDEIFDTASELKYSNEFKVLFASQLQNPTDDFIRVFLSSVYSGTKTQAVIDKFRIILKKSLNTYISELMNDRIKSALDGEAQQIASAQVQEKEVDAEIIVPEEPTVVTTNEELEAYFIVKNILKPHVAIEDISYKDTVRYINVIYKNNVRNWICRLVLTDTKKTLILPDADKKEVKISISGIYEIENYSEQLIEVLSRYQ